MFEANSAGFIGVMVTIAGSVWTLAWWLSGHFNMIRKEILALGKELVEKLEYHERHDDVRFDQVQNAITDIRVRNAASDALLVIREKRKELD
jgi:hypothetical protein